MPVHFGAAFQPPGDVTRAFFRGGEFAEVVAPPVTREPHAISVAVRHSVDVPEARFVCRTQQRQPCGRFSRCRTQFALQLSHIWLHIR